MEEIKVIPLNQDIFHKYNISAPYKMIVDIHELRINIDEK
jgi:hypothetical protein